jgi:myo-inositol-1(or 4)-monophosphatase
VRARDAGTLEGVRAAGPRRHLEELAAKVPGVEIVPKIHSLALRLARVAQGAIDIGFAARASNDWDLAAADLLVHEAGGALTDVGGRVLTYNRTDPEHGALVAAGLRRHGLVLELVAAARHEFA